MYIIKNAYKSIIRAKGRNILIFILVFLIALSACVALSVRNSAESAKETAYNALSITAQISTDRQGIMGGASIPGTADHVEYLDSLNATTDLNVLLSLMGISILLTLAAGSVGMISVLRYEPLKILSER